MNKRKDRGHIRQMNLEMLRILTMLMIITLHFLAHGGVLNAIQQSDGKYYLYWGIAGGCYIAVNCFVLITGYFQSLSKFRIKKLILMFAEVWFYSLVIYGVLCFFNIRQFAVKDFMVALFPVLNSEYWFVTIYAGLYILSPLINWVLNRLERRQHLLLVFVLILLFSVWPNVFFLSVGLNFGGGFGIVWFFVLYCVGAYIRKYTVKDRNVWRWMLRYITLTFMIPLSKFVLAGVSEKYLKWFIPDNLFYSYNSVLVFAASVALFGTFLRIEIKSTGISRIISFLSGSVFGVYLIHDNPYVRECLWEKLNVCRYLERNVFLLVMLVTILVIYIAATFTDKIRILLFQRLLKDKQLEQLSTYIENKAKRIYDCFEKDKKDEQDGYNHDKMGEDFDNRMF